MLHKGRLINKIYCIEELISSGGMGEVYLARNKESGAEVAIKVIWNSGHTLTSRTIDNFHKEAETVARLKHPSILPLLDHGKDIDEGVLYMIMPYCPERDFASWLKRHHPNDLLTPEEIAHFLHIAADALQYVHHEGMVHRDVKLSNFLVSSQQGDPNHPHICLTDFGIARNSIAEMTIGTGTAEYMPPEQWNGNASPLSDQYALAIMIYKLLTGDYPFYGTRDQLRIQHCKLLPPRPSSKNNTLTGAIDTVLLRALEKDPNRRYPSVVQFDEAFQRALRTNIPTWERTISPSMPLTARIQASLLQICISTLLTLFILLALIKSPWGTFLISPWSTPPPSNVIKIGVDLPLSGNYVHDGQPVLNAIKLEIGKASIPGYTLELDYRDDVGTNELADPNVGAQNVSRFINDAQDAGIIGPFNSDVAIDEIPLANKAPIALISPTNTSPCLTLSNPPVSCPGISMQRLRPTNKITYFRTATLDSGEGKVLANFLYSTQHYKTVCIFHDKGIYGQSFSQSFKDEWKALGGTVLYDIPAPTVTDQQSYTNLFAPVSEKPPDVVFFAGNTPNATIIHTIMEHTPSLAKTAFAGGGGIINESFQIHIGGPESGPVFAVTPLGDINGPEATNGLDFASSYHATYNGFLTPYSASGYDCARIVLQAIIEAIKTVHPPTNSADQTQAQAFRQEVIKQIQNIDYSGVTGQHSFDANGDTTHTSVSIYQLDTTHEHWNYLSEQAWS